MAGSVIDSSTGFPMTPEQEAIYTQEIISKMPLVDPVSYIVGVGDEPSEDVRPLDLSQYVESDVFENIKAGLTYLPRQFFTKWFDENIGSSVEKTYQPIMKKSFLNLFNTVNLSEINRRSITPWEWEAVKMRTRYGNEANLALKSQVDPSELDHDSIMKLVQNQIRGNLEMRYAGLPPIADTSLEVQRQASIKRLLDDGEYDLVEKIIAAYENAKAGENEVIQTAPTPTKDAPVREAFIAVVSSSTATQPTREYRHPMSALLGLG